jgi:CRISPR-associated protein Csd1
MQRQALGRRNATIVDKYYGAASATPAAVFPTLMSLCRKHSRKAKDARPGAVVNREREIDVILEKLKQVPRHLGLADQGMFVLGYHHQRHALMNRQWSFAQVEEEPTEPPEDAAELELAI